MHSGSACARQVIGTSLLRPYDLTVSHLSFGHLLHSVAALAVILRGAALSGTFSHGFRSWVSGPSISKASC
jgi:hypothetical protein